jgi:transketolase
VSEASGPAEMRRAFADELVALGATEPRLVVLDNDVGLTSLSQRFREAYPERYIDLGVAEKNLFGTAAGLAAAGMIAMPTTFAVFATRCALDQVSISIAYPALDVKIPGHYIGGSRAGSSHIAIEDLAVYRALPNMRVVDPVDAAELRAVMRLALATPGPVYFRVYKLAVPDVLDPADAAAFAFGRGRVLREGRDVTLFGTGLMSTFSLRAAELLAAEGIDAAVVHLASVKPIDADLIAAWARRTGAAVASEMAGINGGFGSAVAEVLGERCPVPLRRIGFRDVWPHSGSIEQILDHYALRPADIAAAAREAIATGRGAGLGELAAATATGG